MTERRKPIPEWAQNERLRDHAWVRANRGIFYFLASLSFLESGRGAIVVDTTNELQDTGHPSAYFTQEMIEQDLDEHTQRMVHEYDPEKEFVVVLLKPEEKTSTYRVRQQPKKPSGNY